HQISEITVIPESALQGAPLSAFLVNERFSWMQPRETKLEEDKAYSLLGIFGVYVPPIYGEGKASAFKRLREEIGKLEQCMQDLRLTNPRDDKKRIEDTNGGLLKDSYRWVLGNANFQRWRDDRQSRLLWIKGDPGKGKTMLLCGIANELTSSMAKTALLSYFFCQATDSRINSAAAVLRGLLYLLVNQQPSLISHVRKKYDQAGKTLFEDTNAWVALTEIFTDVLQDPSLNTTYLIVDALDECITDLPKLLDFVVKQSSASSRVKWIVSSRNWPDIEERLERAGHKVRLSLELNAESVSKAVSIFIEQKVSQLAQQKRYNERTQDAVRAHLASNANNTFLWVALSIREIIAICGSFLTLREETIYFVHQSAKDFLLARAAKEVFLSRKEDVHYTIFARSIETMSRTLQRDMYGLEALGYPVEDVEQLDPDPLAASRYSCMYWVDHLCDSNLKSSASCVHSLQDGGVVDVFLKKKYLYWLEALSLYRSIPKAVVSIAKLQSLVQHEEPKWVTIKPAPGASWSACLQTLEGHSGSV
ncbi:NACHT-domain-containing protein, partial [Periconia macrospinosa]